MNFLIDVFYYVIYRTIWLSARKSWGCSTQRSTFSCIVSSVRDFDESSKKFWHAQRKKKSVVSPHLTGQARTLQTVTARESISTRKLLLPIYNPANFPYYRNMLWVCSDFYNCERFTFPAAPRHGMNNGVQERFREAAPGISRGLVVTVPDWSFCNWKTLWSSLWREGNFFLVPGFLSRYELSCWKWRIRHPCIPSLLAIEASEVRISDRLMRVRVERLGYPVSDIEIGLAYHLVCRSRSRCWNIVSKVGLCRRDKYLTMALGRGVVLTRPLPNKIPSVGMKQLKLKLLDNTYG